MKMLKIISSFLVIILILCSLQTISFAETESKCEHMDGEVTVEFFDEISDFSKEKIIAHFNGKDMSGIETRGLICTLFGHKIETGTTSTITHKARTSSPRCLKETFTYEVCSRCEDYAEYNRISYEYIVCCS